MIAYFASHRVAANLLMILMTLAGLWALRAMPTQLDPPAQFPLVFVEIRWPDAGAEDIESLVTLPIEQQLRTVQDLREMRSQTEYGFVRITLEFRHGADMAAALDQVKQRVANTRNLPPGIEPPVVRRFFDMEPIASLQVSGPGSVGDLVPLVRRFERELMARGVEGVEWVGLPREEIAVMVPTQRLRELGLTLDELAALTARHSQNVPAGMVGAGPATRTLRSLDQRRSTDGFGALEFSAGDQLVRLDQIADIERRPQRGEPRLTRQGDPVIEMVLLRASGSDARTAHRAVEAWLGETRPNLPDGVHVEKVLDIWALLGAQLDMVLKNALSGLVLVLLTLYVFLSGRVAWWVMLGIPVSFLLGLALFHLVFGQGISIVALIGFIMALGIVVDDAIVVGEDATTQFESGLAPLDAAIAGAERMWVPVLTSSMTTLAAFIPLLLIGGPMGEIILTLPTVLFCVIVASLIECFLVLPGHLRGSLGRMSPAGTGPFGASDVDPADRRRRWGFDRARFDARFRAFRDDRFMPLVRRALAAPGRTLGGALVGVVLAASLVASGHVGIALVLGFDIERLEANVTFGPAAREADKAAFLAHLEETLGAVDDETGRANLIGWTLRHNLARFGTERLAGEQYAALTASYAYEEHRTLAPQAFVNRWRERIVQPPYVEQLTVAVGGGQNNGQPDLTFVLRGEDLEALKRGAEELANALAGYAGVSNIVDDLPWGGQQIIFELTPEGLSLGLTADAVGRQLRAAYSGARVQIFNEQASELEVRVMLADAERNDPGRLAQYPIRTPDGEFVALGSVARLYSRRGVDLIRHREGQLAVTVSASVDPEVGNALAITADVSANALPAILARHELAFGLGGKSEQDQMIISTLGLGAVLTLVLIYLVLTWTFASWTWPLAIMLAIPFGLTGAVVGHWVTGWDIGAMSFLAFFALTGVVVNDSIVLISCFKREVESGTPIREALERAVQARFRAVLLTSLTTIAGLLPLMFERSSLAFYVAPIAVTLCFGLAFATLLVLLVIPALLLLLESAPERLRALQTTVSGWLGADEPVHAPARRTDHPTIPSVTGGSHHVDSA
ncbi:MAG: efflux RND transporter permease subunit [Pseudomonadales bacterium]|nr:efflux RND transporter permease subunit [Pseudomonadales bacterium]